ncbi:hypothetical protein [Chryseobacterium indoltheticum]|jgi:peptidoglycan/LPS O-acetylase OafA/YrhL|uniref:Uncharacterized protein n=1 Tax=Chryseobacterium indoltheticum TaxID=254 RepID=A0A381FA76_9FLAO|nr:hypothetical protein [Chryseobacterium indoltheticum]MDF2832783.1 hypothetical protein [Chryseobacterium indoltheticum]SUX43364.1 Uncharacterised protein [Chryseobacterium indoltheticum]
MENSNPKIYSKNAILGFSIFMSVLFGGILLYQNLINIKKKKEAYTVLIVSIVLTIISIIIVNIPENPKSFLAYLCGFGGGSLLAKYFVPKYFPDEEKYPKKTIWKPLIIAIMIMIIFIGAIFYSVSTENYSNY